MNETATPIAVIITAAGASRRMGGEKKEYRFLPKSDDGTGRPLTVLGASVLAFALVPGVKTIVITYPPADNEGSRLLRALPSETAFPSPAPAIILVAGGETRRASVFHALEALAERDQLESSPRLVLIHDGARPWTDRPLIERVIAAALEHGAAVPVLPLSETPKEIDGGLITAHLKRARIVTAQTPQAFAWPRILEAHRAAEKQLSANPVSLEPNGGPSPRAEYTDDAEIWAAFAGKTAAVPGSMENKKITFPGDLP